MDHALVHTMELGFLKPEPAKELFKKYCTRLSDTEVELLLIQVDYRTLTIEILAKTAQRRRLDYTTLSQALPKNERAGIKTAHSQQQRLERISDYLCSIFELNLLSDDQKWLLKQLACLPSDMHSYSQLQDWVQAHVTGREDRLSETLEELQEQGWLLAQPTENRYKMHAIIQYVVRKKLNPSLGDISPMLERFIHLLNYENHEYNPVKCFPYVVIGKSIADYLENDPHERLAVLRSNLALVLKDLGDLATAKSYIEKALTSDLANFGEEHPATAISYSKLALVLKARGDYKNAIAYMELALTSTRKNFGEEHSTTASNYSDLATILREMKDYKRAQLYMEKALAIDRKNFGDEHATIAIRYSNLGLILQNMGDHETAKIYMELALAIDKNFFGDEHPLTVIRYSNLGLLLRDLGDSEKAKRYIEHALTIDKKNYGDEHPLTALRYWKMAALLSDVREYDQALKLCKKALRTFKQMLPAGHKNILNCERWVKDIQQAIDDKDKGSGLLIDGL